MIKQLYFKGQKIKGTGSFSFEVPGIDPECRRLCDALNNMKGISTICSCSGHNKRNYHIWFVAESLEDLPPVLYYFDACEILEAYFMPDRNL